MCIECEYVGRVQEVMWKMKKGNLSNSDMLEEMTTICLEYWKECAKDREEE